MVSTAHSRATLSSLIQNAWNAAFIESVKRIGQTEVAESDNVVSCEDKF